MQREARLLGTLQIVGQLVRRTRTIVVKAARLLVRSKEAKITAAEAMLVMASPKLLYCSKFVFVSIFKLLQDMRFPIGIVR